MGKKTKPEPDNKEQSERFIETARELESDESGKAFERVVNKITPKATPAHPSEKKSAS